MVRSLTGCLPRVRGTVAIRPPPAASASEWRKAIGRFFAEHRDRLVVSIGDRHETLNRPSSVVGTELAGKLSRTPTT